MKKRVTTDRGEYVVEIKTKKDAPFLCINDDQVMCRVFVIQQGFLIKKKVEIAYFHISLPKYNYSLINIAKKAVAEYEKELQQEKKNKAILERTTKAFEKWNGDCRDTGGWWCPTCMCIIPNEEVTSECHIVCGAYLAENK